jgi:hypothetical protein
VKEAKMATSTTAPKTPAQRKALAAKIAKAREAGATGQALRDQFGEWLTGPERRKLLREFGHYGLIARSYDRAEAKAKREAKMAAMNEASAARTAKPRKAAEKAAPSAC